MNSFFTLFIILIGSYQINTQISPESVQESIQIDDSIRVEASNISEIVPPRNDFLDWLYSLTGIGRPTTVPTPTAQPPSMGENVGECDKSCSCGVSAANNRIVGGELVNPNQYPWMVRLHYGRTLYCGGSLLNDRYVLTAGHCVFNFDKSRITVELFENVKTSNGVSRTVNRTVSAIIVHKNFNRMTYNNDLALLRLDSPVKLMAPFTPICMPEIGRSFTGREGIAAGYGATKQGESSAGVLRHVVVPIMSNKDCQTNSSYTANRITQNMMCAGYLEGGKDSCQGDSGSPLHILEENTESYHIVGITSWGIGCAKPGYPGIYTRVNRYDTWIRSNTKDACYCERIGSSKRQ